ncbi:IS6 family transposase [Streptomyces sp. NPDC047860]|uniref:IS6 family transposase n=1 Tax=Streptomyces sp. NPDC047860 TaxID=3155743 RepID=UPI0033F92C8A
MGGTPLLYKRHRYPVEIIAHCGWLYFRFPLSFREVEELMLERGVIVSHDTVRRWCAKFGQSYANGLRRRQPRPGDKWHVDEVFLKINGEQKYLRRAVDADGNVLDILVQNRRDTAAARRFFRTLLTKKPRPTHERLADSRRGGGSGSPWSGTSKDQIRRPRVDLAQRLQDAVRERWQPRVCERARRQAATSTGLVIDTRARWRLVEIGRACSCPVPADASRRISYRTHVAMCRVHVSGRVSVTACQAGML